MMWCNRYGNNDNITVFVWQKVFDTMERVSCVKLAWGGGADEGYNLDEKHR